MVLPIYNVERFLRDSVLSIRAQTLTDFEVIAILDGCTDRSEVILNELKDERFIVHKKEQNEGVAAASILGLREASGEFVGRMDADDVMDSRRLEWQVEFLRAHSDIDIVGTWFDYIDEQGRRVRDALPFPQTHEEILHGFRSYMAVGGPTVMCRTNRIRAIGGFDPEFAHAEDLRLMLKALANGLRIANLPEVLYHYREHASQLNRVRRRETHRNSDLSYREFGPLIWGKDAPNPALTAPLVIRLIRKIKRTLRQALSPRT